MFVLLSMNIFRLSWQSSKWIANFVKKVLSKYEQSAHLNETARTCFRAFPMIRNVASARERDFTAQMFRWCCAPQRNLGYCRLLTEPWIIRAAKKNEQQCYLAEVRQDMPSSACLGRFWRKMRFEKNCLPEQFQKHCVWLHEKHEIRVRPCYGKKSWAKVYSPHSVKTGWPCPVSSSDTRVCQTADFIFLRYWQIRLLISKHRC